MPLNARDVIEDFVGEFITIVEARTRAVNGEGGYMLHTHCDWIVFHTLARV